MNRKKPVICVETGRVYASIKQAADAVYTGPNNISQVLKGNTKTAAGYHWQYAPIDGKEKDAQRSHGRSALRPKTTIRAVQEEARRQTEQTGHLVRYADIQKEETLRMVNRRTGLDRPKQKRREKR